MCDCNLKPTIEFFRQFPEKLLQSAQTLCTGPPAVARQQIVAVDPSGLCFPGKLVLILVCESIRGGGGHWNRKRCSVMFDSARVRGNLRCYDAIDRVFQWAVLSL